MLNRLNNGSFPNPLFRTKMLNILERLPVTSENITRSGAGKILTVLQKSGEEIPTNKHLIKRIKDKWSRVLCRSAQEGRDDVEQDVTNRHRLRQPFIANHIRDASSMTRNYMDIEASQVRRLKRRYDFVHAPPSNQPLEHVHKEKVK